MKAARAGKRFQKVRLDTGKRVYQFDEATLTWIGKGGSANIPLEEVQILYGKIE